MDVSSVGVINGYRYEVKAAKSLPEDVKNASDSEKKNSDVSEKKDSDAIVEISNSTQPNQLSAEDKIKQAEAFLAQHDALYAEQMAAVMDTMNDGMQVAQEIYRRMASGAKVSKSDEQSLMEYDPKMYMAAKNAQMMAERHRDMSKESLIEKFEERHANDRKDWTSELSQQIQKIQQSEKNEGENAEIAVKKFAALEGVVSKEAAGNIDISI